MYEGGALVGALAVGMGVGPDLNPDGGDVDTELGMGGPVKVGPSGSSGRYTELGDFMISLYTAALEG